MGHCDPRIPEGAVQDADNVTGRVDESVIWLVAPPGRTPMAFAVASPWLGCSIGVVTREQAVTFGIAVPDGFTLGFLDPCHGGPYALDGSHLAGPGSRGLARFPTRIDADGNVLVDLTMPRIGQLVVPLRGLRQEPMAPTTLRFGGDHCQ